MPARLRAHLRHHWIAYLALFFAITGSAAALDGTNTVDSGDIIDNQVKSQDVRNDTLTAGGVQAVDLRAGSVGASEVLDDSLTASDLAGIRTLDGSGVVRTDDTNPDTSSPTTVLLKTVGAFQLTGRCNIDAGGNTLAQVRIQGSSQAGSFLVHSNGSNGETDSTGHEGLPGLDTATLIAVGPTDVQHFFAGDFAIATATTLFTGEAVAGTNDLGNDCVFGVTAIG